MLRDDFGRFLGRIPPTISIVGSVAAGVATVALLRWRDFGRVDVLDLSWRGLGLAALAALSFAAVAVAADLMIGFPVSLNVPWPRSLIVYPVMAVVAEVVFHLVPLTVLVVVADVGTDGERGAAALFCFLAVALVETVYQVRSSWRSGVRATLVGFVAVHLTALGFLQLMLLWGHGLAAMAAFRLVYYACWHIAWGALRLR